MTRPSHSSWFHEPNNNLWVVQTTSIWGYYKFETLPPWALYEIESPASMKGWKFRNFPHAVSIYVKRFSTYETVTYPWVHKFYKNVAALSKFYVPGCGYVEHPALKTHQYSARTYKNLLTRGPWRPGFVYPCIYLYSINRQVFVKKSSVFFAMSCIFGHKYAKDTTNHVYKCDCEIPMLYLNLSGNRQNQSMAVTRVFTTSPVIFEEVNQKLKRRKCKSQLS